MYSWSAKIRNEYEQEPVCTCVGSQRYAANASRNLSVRVLALKDTQRIRAGTCLYVCWLSKIRSEYEQEHVCTCVGSQRYAANTS